MGIMSVRRWQAKGALGRSQLVTMQRELCHIINEKEPGQMSSECKWFKTKAECHIPFYMRTSGWVCACRKWKLKSSPSPKPKPKPRHQSKYNDGGASVKLFIWQLCAALIVLRVGAALFALGHCSCSRSPTSSPVHLHPVTRPPTHSPAVYLNVSVWSSKGQWNHFKMLAREIKQKANQVQQRARGRPLKPRGVRAKRK